MQGSEEYTNKIGATKDTTTLHETTPLLLQRATKTTTNNPPHASRPQRPVSHVTVPTVIVLLLDVQTRRFELVALQRSATCTTVKHVIQLLPTAIQDEALQNIKVVALVDRLGKERRGSFPLPTLPAWLVVAVTPHVSARQGIAHARKLLQDPQVQATVRVVCLVVCFHAILKNAKCQCSLLERNFSLF